MHMQDRLTRWLGLPSFIAGEILRDQLHPACMTTVSSGRCTVLLSAASEVSARVLPGKTTGAVPKQTSPSYMTNSWPGVIALAAWGMKPCVHLFSMQGKPYMSIRAVTKLSMTAHPQSALLSGWIVCSQQPGEPAPLDPSRIQSRCHCALLHSLPIPAMPYLLPDATTNRDIDVAGSGAAQPAWQQLHLAM